jgi:hypothetical protein
MNSLSWAVLCLFVFVALFEVPVRGYEDFEQDFSNNTSDWDLTGGATVTKELFGSNWVGRVGGICNNDLTTVSKFTFIVVVLCIKLRAIGLWNRWYHVLRGSPHEMELQRFNQQPTMEPGRLRNKYRRLLRSSFITCSEHQRCAIRMGSFDQ